MLKFMKSSFEGLAIIGAMLCATGAEAQFPNYPEPDLPTLNACKISTLTPLPEKWTATALMSPYSYSGATDDVSNLPDRAPLQVGRLEYDGTNTIMRATLYGVKSAKSYDRLLTDGATYLLSGEYGNPRCIGQITPTLPVPSRVWQNEAFVPECVGNSGIAPTMHNGPKADWWKQKSPVLVPGAQGEAADWYWVNDKGYPLRTMFWDAHEGLPSVIGEFAFSNFPSFEADDSVDLSGLAALCQSANSPEMSVEQAMELVQKEASLTPNPAGQLIPGLSYEGCADFPDMPPSWPADIYATSFSTAAKYGTPKPLPTSVTYSAEMPQLRTRLHEITNGALVFSDALLVGRTSYGVNFAGTAPFNQQSCAAGPNTSLPGAPKNNWGAVGQCQCQAIIDMNPVLSPGKVTQVISCPMPLVANPPVQPQAGNTLFWMWYAMSDPMEPVVFMQTQPNVTVGTGLSLADYYHWEPKVAELDVFTLPTICPVLTPAQGNPPPPNCMGCHNASTNDK